MQNKRGISQAFARPSGSLEIRPASVFDVFAMSRVLTESIRDLCHADHGGDPQRIAAWTADISPRNIRAWFGGTGQYLLAERNGQAEAVGGLDRDGTVKMLYVASGAAGQGAGAAMLTRLETELRGAGHIEGQLDTTRTALGFFMKYGWRQEGAAAAAGGPHSILMRKTLA